MSSPKGPYRLVTVNTAPERAKRLIGRVVEDMKEQYTIEHVANCETINEVEPTVKKYQPDLLVGYPSILSTVVQAPWYCIAIANRRLLRSSRLSYAKFCASMWTPEESTRIQEIARANVPGIRTHAIPQGLQVEKGPDAVVEYLKEQIPGLFSVEP